MGDCSTASVKFDISATQVYNLYTPRKFNIAPEKLPSQ